MANSVNTSRIRIVQERGSKLTGDTRELCDFDNDFSFTSTRHWPLVSFLCVFESESFVENRFERTWTVQRKEKWAIVRTNEKRKPKERDAPLVNKRSISFKFASYPSKDVVRSGKLAFAARDEGDVPKVPSNRICISEELHRARLVSKGCSSCINQLWLDSWSKNLDDDPRYRCRSL